ncbi:class I SAM-dependent methyltransferase [Croceicoccus estronivorus]|uniref:class I SAM-dependent methyltransferase n=1 Tax=Croceicoccus estronivorus TaxID=1172626 RepID=UPI001F2E8AAE|nr:class I SAM-dependent methyltransferase [Croceicoccus estronivorus]
MTRQIATAVGATRFGLGLDISADLVAAASDRAMRTGFANIRLVQGDTAAVMPEKAPFDRLFSRFGLFFLPSPILPSPICAGCCAKVGGSASRYRHQSPPILGSAASWTLSTSILTC